MKKKKGDNGERHWEWENDKGRKGEYIAHRWENTPFSLKDFLNPPEKEHSNATDLNPGFLHL